MSFWAWLSPKRTLGDPDERFGLKAETTVVVVVIIHLWVLVSNLDPVGHVAQVFVSRLKKGLSVGHEEHFPAITNGVSVGH